MTAGARASREDGMSLVEMMVALLVLGVVLSALASVLITALWSVRGQEATTQATAAINDILEEAQRVEYDVAVLCDTKADAAFGPAGEFEGEDLVLSPDICDEPGEIEPERTVTRDGRDYDVTTAITWTDDPGDGLDTADADTPQDIKRITVDVAWTVDGETRTARNMAFRAPQLREQMLTAEVFPDDGSEFIQIADDSSDDGENNEPFTLRAVAREKMTAVQVEWVDRNGAIESKPMTPESSAGLVWELHLGANFGPFANGGTLFRFDGTSSAGTEGDVAVRGLFLYDPMELMGSGIQEDFGGGPLRIDRSSGAVCPGQAVQIDVKGAIRSDVARAEWPRSEITSPPDGMLTVDLPEDEADVALSGTRFRLELGGRTDFATLNDETGEYELIVNPNHVRVVVNRVVDDAEITRNRDTMQMQMVDAC